MAYALPFIAGIVAALVNIAIASRLPAKKASEYFNLFMAATAAFYFGSALAVSDTNVLWLEAGVSATLFVLALAGQWSSLRFTSIAFLLHGVWDLLHVVKGMGAPAGVNFPILCVAYDWVIAGYLWWMAAAESTDRLRTATN